MSGYKGNLTITIIGADGLTETNVIGKQDPFAKLSINKQTFKTKVCENGGKNPKWNETFEFNLDGSEESLSVHLFDDRVVKDTKLCWIDIVISELAGRPDPTWYNLLKNNDIPAGRVQISTKFVGEIPYGATEVKRIAEGETVSFDRLLPKFRQYLVEVHIIAARDLKNKDIIGESDPYCIVHFDKNTALRTRVVDDNLNPIWDHKLYALIPPGEQSILVEVFDKDDNAVDDSLGSVVLPLAGNFERRQGWYPLKFGMLEKDQGEIHISYTKMNVGDLVELKPRLDSANRQIDQLKSAKKQLLESLELLKLTSTSEKKDVQAIIERLKVDEEKEKTEKKELASQVDLLNKQVQEWSSATAQTKQQKDELEKQMSEITAQYQRLQSEDKEKESAKQELSSHLKTLQAQMEAFRTQAESHSKNLESQLQAKATEATTLNERLAHLQAVLLEAKQEDEVTRKKLEAQIEAQIQKRTAVETEHMKQEAQMKVEVATLSAQLQSLEFSKSEDEKAKNTLREQISALNSLIDNFKANDAVEHKTIADLRLENAHLQTRVNRISARKLVTSLDFIWNDSGSGARTDVSFWRPKVPANYVFFGDVAEPVHYSFSTTFVVPDDPELYAKPLGYELIWRTSGTKSARDVSIWAPRPPEGFVAVGHVAWPNFNAPDLPQLRCVKRSLVTNCESAIVWSDKGTHATMDGTFWRLKTTFNTFMGVKNYSAPDPSFAFADE